VLAPAAGDVLVGEGPCEVRERIAWERADVASLWTDGAPPESLRGALASFDVALVYSASEALARGLQKLVRDVRARVPAPQGLHAAGWLLGLAAGLLPSSTAPGAPSGTPATPSKPPAAPPAFRASAAEQAAARPFLDELPGAFLAIHAGSGSAAKNWPAERFAQLPARLSYERHWLLIDGPADRDVSAALQRVPGAVVARELKPRVLGALLSHAGIYVGNDSGVSHLAAAFDAPTLALFGPTEPALWSPRGERVMALRAPGGTLLSLGTEDVVTAAERLRRAP
jgi:ADP-heptose:LPS heptosyltransferase